MVQSSTSEYFVDLDKYSVVLDFPTNQRACVVSRFCESIDYWLTTDFFRSKQILPVFLFAPFGRKRSIER